MINPKTTLFSIIIPCYNEELYLEQCLRSLKNQDYPKERYEIIVVDNGSTDSSPKIAERYTEKVLHLPDAKVGEVRNAGAKIASGEYLVFIDADCSVDSQWLTRAEALASQSQNIVFGGGIILPENANWIERHWLLEGPSGNTLPSELIGCSIVISSKIFHSIQGFDITKSSGEDTNLSIRLRKKGIEIVTTRQLNVMHLGNAKTLLSHIKRQAWHAKSYRAKKENRLHDPVFILVVTHILITLQTFIFIILNLPGLSLISAVTVLILPAILTTKRFYRANRPPSDIKELLLAYVLDLAYISGRAIGYVLPPYR